MKEMNTLIGKNQAYLENLSEQYQREALSTLFYGTQSDLFKPEEQEKLNGIHDAYVTELEKYQNGDQEAGLTLQEFYELTQETAQAYYDSSGIMQAKKDAEIDHLAAIRENTAGLESAYYSFEESQEASKGMGAVALGSDPVQRGLSMAESTWKSILGGKSSAPGFASGLDRVPYDNYPALLHEGERVLTAREARAEDQGDAPGGIHITITGNNFQGTAEDMADQIASILSEKLQLARRAG